MVILFHGTDSHTANQLLAGRIDVGRGGGEFGRGFYLGSSKRLAKRRAFHKTENTQGTAAQAMNAKIPNTLYIEVSHQQLNYHYHPSRLSLPESIKLYQQLKHSHQAGTYLTQNKADFIRGFLVGTGRYYNVIQYKFESQRSQDLLNGHNHKVPITRKLL